MDSTSLIFYTCIYIDPRKPGRYEYGEYVFDYEPFYVGKGKYRQDTSHVREAKEDRSIKWLRNTHKTNKIKNILKENLEPIILKVKENILERESFELEIYLMWAIGRKDLKTGPLTNLTDGGEGMSGRIKSKEEREKLIYWKGKKLSFGHKLKMSEARKGKEPWNKGLHGVYSPEAYLKITTARVGKIASNETRQKMSNAQKGEKHWLFGKQHSLKTKQKMSESQVEKHKERKLKK